MSAAFDDIAAYILGGMRKTEPLRDREAEALAIVDRLQPCSRGYLAETMGVAPNTAGVYLWALSKRGLVKSTGPGRTSKWVAT